MTWRRRSTLYRCVCHSAVIRIPSLLGLYFHQTLRTKVALLRKGHTPSGEEESTPTSEATSDGNLIQLEGEDVGGAAESQKIAVLEGNTVMPQPNHQRRCAKWKLSWNTCMHIAYTFLHVWSQFVYSVDAH